MNNSTNNNSIGLLWLGLALALGLIIASLLLSSALESIKSGEQTVTVKGYAEKNITSDLGVWNGYVSVRSYDLVSGYAKLQSDITVLSKYLKEKGVHEDMIKLGPVTNYASYRYTADGRSTGELSHYNLERAITVTSSDVKLIEVLASESTSLIQQGLEINSSLPQFFYTKLNDLKTEMLGRATEDAKDRARVIAEGSGSKVKSINSATQGVFQITAPNSSEISDWGEFNTSSVEKTIKAVVTASFTIK